MFLVWKQQDSESHQFEFMRGRTACAGVNFVRRNFPEEMPGFFTGAVVDNFLFTDSSRARRLSMRQGAGKIKHLSGKILWIQQWVMEGKIVLVQVPTLWNLSDIGTKPLSGQRMKLLMHELNMAHGDCSELVGKDEFEEQCQRHGHGKQVTKLAKAVAQVMLLAGLGSNQMVLQEWSWTTRSNAQ